MDFCTRLKELREAEGLTQKELAVKVNVKGTTICKYETGALEPSFDMLKKLAGLFGVSTDYLLGYPVDLPEFEKGLIKDYWYVVQQLSIDELGHLQEILASGKTLQEVNTALKILTVKK